MLKNKITRLTVAFHIAVLILIAAFAMYRSDVNKQQYIDSVTTELHGITKTVSVIGTNTSALNLIHRYDQSVEVETVDPDYLRLSTDFQHILVTNGLDDCELSFIIKSQVDDTPVRLASSDRLYGFGDPLFDRDGLIDSQLANGASALIDVNEDIKKIMAFDPVFASNGDPVGIVRIETGDRSAELQAASDVYWMSTPFFLYLLIASIFTLVLAKRNNTKDVDKEEQPILDELKRKNNELKMLSLVAKKSENLMLITDDRGHILWVNETYEEKNNYSAEELNKFTGKYLHEVSQNENIRTIIKNVVDFNEPITYECSNTDANGVRHFAMTTVTPISDEHGNASNLLFVDTDITKIKMAEEKHSIFRNMVENCQLPLIVIHRTGDVTFSNIASKSILKEWTDSKGELKEDIKAMLISVLDIGEKHVIEIFCDGKSMQLEINPETENQTLMVLGILDLDEYSTNAENITSDNDNREAV